MGFHIRDRPWVNSGFCQTGLNRIGLSHRTRNRNSAHSADMIDRTPFNDRVDSVSVLHSFAKRLEQDGSYTLAGNISVSSFAEGMAVSIAGEHVPNPVGQIFARMQRKMP
ncbi:hypothetical protein D3C87_683250 [compost metagenome]